MPKSSGLITERDKLIGERLRELRYLRRLSQPKFAAALKETTDRIASIEYARTPMTVEMADKICKKFDVNILFLIGDKDESDKPNIGLISRIVPGIQKGALLSSCITPEIREKLLKQYNAGWSEAFAILLGQMTLPKGKGKDYFVKRFHESFDALFARLPHNGKEKLLALVIRTLSKFDMDWFFLHNHKNPGENIVMFPNSKASDEVKK